MRDLTKAAGHFTWSLSLFGARQVANLLTPPSSGRAAHPATEGFESVSRVATERLGPILDSSYRAGVTLQDELVDLAFDAWSPQAFDPRWWGARTAQLARASIESLGQLTQEGGGEQSGAGWGPMPFGSGDEDCG